MSGVLEGGLADRGAAIDMQDLADPGGKMLRLELPASATVRWSFNNWATVNDTPARKTDFESHFVDLPAQDAAEGLLVVFTFLWLETGQWENDNFTVRVGE